jgi:hypothetical protein
MELTFSAFSSQISEMEIQISGLKEHLDKEHQKWRSSQTNYERQVRTHFFIYIAYMSCLFHYLGYSAADAVWLHDLSLHWQSAPICYLEVYFLCLVFL